ncbi:cytochrome d ubiquinol oxidase subunit II [Nitratiruptor sp. SB155-2]|uniref:cytochrome d ubiquinol oxidase subunit II n=1 Tax=Nitratiruptor sp. (strain SB155-2) TaxID=387092 RepID=UPI0001586F3D|nr:cytochrome d ubiquinol oxidase subunit II [Nitratiruptor sp. SB155-2]BAF69264.1 cytochrome bd oxidase subunit II [Nitratiruptor sp. SB155-2]
MFENMSTYTLQEYWWFIVSLLGGLFLFLTFVQGGQTKLGLAGNEEQKDLIVNALGRKWELTFTTLVLFGGALFAAFPLFYAVSFGGAYGLWMAILFSFIIQAVAYEYRKKPNNFFGQKVYELFLFLNGTVGIFLIGVALASLFTGAAFKLDDMKHMTWLGSMRGLEALGNPFNILFGLMMVFLARLNANLYFMFILDDPELVEKAKKAIKTDFAIFLVLFLAVAGWILSMSGVGYEQNKFFVVAHKYLNNFLEMPFVLGAFVVGVGLLLGAVVMALKGVKKAFWFSSTAITLVGLSLLLVLGYNHTAYYPSIADIGSSLTIENSSGSRVTLITMSYVSLMVPFVVGYIAYVWRLMDSKPLSEDEVENDVMSY